MEGIPLRRLSLDITDTSVMDLVGAVRLSFRRLSFRESTLINNHYSLRRFFPDKVHTHYPLVIHHHNRRTRQLEQHIIRHGRCIMGECLAVMDTAKHPYTDHIPDTRHQYILYTPDVIPQGLPELAHTTDDL